MGVWGKSQLAWDTMSAALGVWVDMTSPDGRSTILEPEESQERMIM